jgi:AcrR family transcriptional regulator
MPRRPLAKPLIDRAALRLFVEKGVDGTSIRDVAAAAGVSEGALYRHYESKDALVWSLFADSYVAFAHRLDNLQTGVADARGKLRAMIHGVCAFHDAEPLLFRFLLFVQHGQLDKVTAEMPSPIDVIRKVVCNATASGEIPRIEPELATAMVVGLVLQPATFTAYGRLLGPLSRHADRLAAAAWNALTATTVEGSA